MHLLPDFKGGAQFILAAIILLARAAAQTPLPEMGGQFRPNYESYRIDKLIAQEEASCSGDLSFSIPLLAVPGRHGHNFEIALSYNSNITQRQSASWVGLGWNLDVGAIERAVNGRTDEGVIGAGGLNNPGDTSFRSMQPGRFNGAHKNLRFELKDQSDSYQLMMDGGGMEILPVPHQIDSSESITEPLSLTPIDFLPIQYKPWNIHATSGAHRELSRFEVTKDDGTVYDFGGAENTEWISVADNHSFIVRQYYEFPYRWNLHEIRYTDGSATVLKHKFQNDRGRKLYRRFESVFIDRSRWNMDKTGNFFGNIEQDHSKYDTVAYSYSHPETLYTDTHYLVFRTSPPTDDATTRNCRLDTLILCERSSRKELERIVFNYAATRNPNGLTCSNGGCASAPDWMNGTRLNNEQLTLIGFTIQNGYSAREEGNSADFQKYRFTYYKNPRIDLEDISTQAYRNNDVKEWPGYYTNAMLAIAWRVKDIILPTGAVLTYAYETYDVLFDPEGRTILGGVPWNSSMPPRSRLKTKSIQDALGSAQTWTYAYPDTVIYDPPSRPLENFYVPEIYRKGFIYSGDQAYKFLRGCQPAHRWVKISNPDGSWKRFHYTTSYHAPGAASAESQPDTGAQAVPGTLGNIIHTSRAGRRGMVWKQETNTTTTIYNYSYPQQGALKDRYDYFALNSRNASNQFVLESSIWARLDSERTTRDGITNTVKYYYNPTPREFPAITNPGIPNYAGNGLLNEKAEFGTSMTRFSFFHYACEKYPAMVSSYMLSQPYSTAVNRNGSLDESKEWTTWGTFGGHWLPRRKWTWNNAGGSPKAPVDTASTGTEVIGSVTFDYDDSGNGNVVKMTDANGNATKYFYSSDITDPFKNTTLGLSSGHVTGVEKPNNFTPGSFNLLSPPNQSPLKYLPVKLTWSPACNASGYDVYVDVVNPPARLAAPDVRDTFYACVNLSRSLTYYWKIVAKNQNGAIPASNAPWSFTTAFPPGVPGPFTLLSPRNDSTVYSSSVKLTWKVASGAMAYDVYLGLSKSPTTLVASNLTSTWHNYTGLNDNGKYYWTVAARNSTGSSAASNGPWAINVIAPLNAPVMISQSSLASTALPAATTSSPPAPSDAVQASSTASCMAIRVSYNYNHYGDVTKQTDENGNITRFIYDQLGRLKAVEGPGSSRVSEFSYFYPAKLSASQPNAITSKAYRSAVDSTISTVYYDGHGYERQRQTRLAGDDIILTTTYDNMWRIDSLYKPYNVTLAQPHTFDLNYKINARAGNSQADTTPYSRNEYYLDGTGRLMHDHAPGSTFQGEGSNHYAKYNYSNGTFGTSQGVDPNTTTQRDTAWHSYPSSVGSIHGVLADGPASDDNTFVKLSSSVSTSVGSFTIRMKKFAGVWDGSALYTLKFRCKRSFTDFSGGKHYLSVQLLEGSVPKGTYNLFWHEIPADEFSTFSLSLPGSDIGNPNNLLVNFYFFSVGGTSPPFSISVSWARVDAGYPLLFTSTSVDENGTSSVAYEDNYDRKIAVVNDTAGLRLASRFDYDVRGNMTRAVNPAKQVYTYVYDSRSLLMQQTTPDAGTTKYKYDLTGNLRLVQSAVQRSAVPERFTYRKYDRNNRLVEIGEYSGPFSAADPGATGNPLTDFPLPGSGNIQAANIYDQNTTGDPNLLTARNLLGKLFQAVSYNNGVKDEVAYSYDEFGRIEWEHYNLYNIYGKRLSYQYDRQSNLTKVSYMDYRAPRYNTYWFYEYDPAGRLARIFSGTEAAGAAKTREAQYTYLANGKVCRMQLGAIQGVDYQYNERDWLKQINNLDLIPSRDDTMNNTRADKFGMVLGYHNVAEIGTSQSAKPQYNGNISWIGYNMLGVSYTGPSGTTSRVGYTFSYDAIGRIRQGDFGYKPSGWQKTGAYDVPRYRYDEIGNIDTAICYGGVGSRIDSLKYNYIANTNKLSYITDMVADDASSIDVDNQFANNYLYDANGNMTKDIRSGIDTVIYDYRNLPLQIRKNGITTIYRYNASGNRVYKSTAGGATNYYVYDFKNRPIGVLTMNGDAKMLNIVGLEHVGYLSVGFQTQIYCGGRGGGAAAGIGSAGAAKAASATAGGGSCDTTYIRADRRFYYLKDHLGTVKMTIDQNGSLASYDDYYPFGMVMEGRSANLGEADTRYKFTSKERDIETGYDYFGARYYDARIGRWMSVDPAMMNWYPKKLVRFGLSNLSSYQYVRNNPIVRVDIDGYTDWDLIKKGALQAAGGYSTAGVGLAVAIGTDGILWPLVGTAWIMAGSTEGAIGIANVVAGLNDRLEVLDAGVMATTLQGLGASEEAINNIECGIAATDFTLMLVAPGATAPKLVEWLHKLNNVKHLSEATKTKIRITLDKAKELEKKRQEEERRKKEEERKREEEKKRKQELKKDQ